MFPEVIQRIRLRSSWALFRRKSPVSGKLQSQLPRDGELDPKIAYALNLLKITELYQIGGVQAIAAFAYGTESVKPVDKIVGPGNVYVALAKKMVYGAVDIDTIAGPSEVVILADETANPEWVALDLLAQAEHGSGNESAVCVTESYALAEKIRELLHD